MLHRLDLAVEGQQALHQKIEKLEARMEHEFVEGGSAGSLPLGLCGFSVWDFGIGSFITKELSNIKSRRAVKTVTLRCLLGVGQLLKRRDRE